jgi:hypothetical protein
MIEAAEKMLPDIQKNPAMLLYSIGLSQKSGDSKQTQPCSRSLTMTIAVLCSSALFCG